MYANKAQIRSKIKQICQNIGKETQNEAKSQILTNLLPLLDNSDNIALYNAYGYELSLLSVIDYCLKKQKKLFVPICYPNTREMLLTKYEDFPNRIFAEATESFKVDFKWYNLDLILLPLVAVNLKGVRLGKGGGYYDTTLANIERKDSKPIFCGVGYDCQLLTDLPTDIWDLKLDYFVSPNGLHKF